MLAQIKWSLQVTPRLPSLDHLDQSRPMMTASHASPQGEAGPGCTAGVLVPITAGLSFSISFWAVNPWGRREGEKVKTQREDVTFHPSPVSHQSEGTPVTGSYPVRVASFSSGFMGARGVRKVGREEQPVNYTWQFNTGQV